MSGNWKTIKQNGKNKHVKMNEKNRKKPFGIQKDMAKKDVDLLRKEGKRARLIETNRRLDLYMPYEATIQSQTAPVVQPKAAPLVVKPEPIPAIQKSESPSENNEPAGTDYIPMATHEAEMAKKLISSVAPDKKYSPYSIYSEDGKTYAMTVDNAHVMMYYAEMDGVTQKPEAPVGNKMHVPKLELKYPNIIVSELLESQQKQLLADISKAKAKKNELPEVAIYKPENSREAYISLVSHEGGENKVLGKPIPIPVKEAGSQPIMSFYPSDYFRKAIAGLRHIDKELGIKHTNISIGLKEDYPIRMIAGNYTTSYNVILAPRMEDDSYQFRSAIDKAVKGEASAQ